MPVERALQASFASGEMDPLLFSREDVAFFYNAARLLENVIALPQGGAKRREGLEFKALQRGALLALDDSGFTPSVTNGGTAANYNDTAAATLLTTTTGISTTTEYVIVSIDLATSTRVSLVDIAVNFNSLPGGITEGTIALQSSTDDITYTTRASFTAGSSYYSRRFALAPDNDLATARYWRVIVDNAGAADFSTATVSLNRMVFYAENGYSAGSPSLGDVVSRRITTSITSEFFAVMTARNCDLFSSAGVWLAAVNIPHVEADVIEIKTSQNLDSLVLYQEDHPVHLIQRLESDTDWRSGVYEFESVSQFPFDDATTGGQNEQQEIEFTGMSAADRFVFEFNGDVSAEVAWSATPATNITNITAALEGMEDFTDVTVTNPSGTSYLIEWVGEDANKFFATLIVDILDGTGTTQITRKQYGRPHQEDLWSATRGYPRCGTFYQGRHFMGGFRSRPDVIAGSRAGDIFDFEEDQDPVATSPLVLSPNIDEQVTVNNIYPGRSLQIFTSAAEIFVPTEPITPDNVALKVSSKRGTQTLTQPVDIQGGTLFVDRNGAALREYLFSEAEQSYTAEPVSILSGHLVRQPIDMALRLSDETDEPTLLYLVNSGRDRDNNLAPPAVITIDRAQQVTGFARINTAGTMKAVAATQGGEVMAVTRRELAGEAWNYIELFNKDHMSDCSIEVANSDAETFTATASQTVFTYTFTSPLVASDVGVFSRATASDLWVAEDPTGYTWDGGAKTITFTTGKAAGTLVYIAPRHTTAALGVGILDGIVSYAHCDGRPVGAVTPAAGSVTIPGDEGFFFDAKIGLRMVPKIILHTFKGRGGRSPTMQKQRIFRAVLSMERTLNMAIGFDGGTARAIALTDYDAGSYDAQLETLLYTGVKRVSGLGRWELEPRLVLTQTEPGPWLLRSCAYDVRY